MAWYCCVFSYVSTNNQLGQMIFHILHIYEVSPLCVSACVISDVRSVNSNNHIVYIYKAFHLYVFSYVFSGYEHFWKYVHIWCIYVAFLLKMKNYICGLLWNSDGRDGDGRCGWQRWIWRSPPILQFSPPHAVLHSVRNCTLERQKIRDEDRNITTMC